MIARKKLKPHMCPYCGSQNIELYDIHFYDDYIENDNVCSDCYGEFSEVYDLTYMGVIFEIEEEKENDD